MLEKLQAFAQGKYETSGTGDDIIQKYESEKGNTVEQMEALDVTKRIVSTGDHIATILIHYSSTLLYFSQNPPTT
jgi:amphiphysin